jgi:bifunctional DNA-binding transcriptional regulator/antitoxin component of YhaV-PrlF toxin-antitoxin module
MLATTVKLSKTGQVKIPKNIFNSLHWEDGMELTLITTESGIMLTPKIVKNKISVKSLRGCLQHTGNPVPTEQLCKPVEYTNDSI